MRPWLEVALRPSVYWRALKVAAVVGTLLALINHWDVLLTGAFTATVWTKVALTYVVPYCVSTYSSVQAILHNAPGASP